MKINIIDSIMGSGKSSYAIQKMNTDYYNNYIYITPFLSEVERIKKEVTGKKFYEPKNIGEGKLDSLHNLILNGKNIASTHALFKTANEDTIALLKANNYILILDEVMEVLDIIDLKKNDLETLYASNLIRVDKDNNNMVIWNEDKLDWDSSYNALKRMCLNRNVFMVNNTLLMWTFPVEVFKAFKEVYVLTYLFRGQIQRYYYDLYKIDYTYFSVNKQGDKFELCDYIDEFDLSEIKSKVDIITNDKINTIGDIKYSLSKSWYENPKNKILIEQLKKNLTNYFTNKVKSSSKDNMWATFKKYKGKLSGNGYTKGFVSLGARATNNYCDKVNLAYTVNVFLNPIIKQFFISKNVDVSEDLYAVSELLQWVWRARIRKGENINLYIPSKRMRELFLDWLDNKIK